MKDAVILMKARERMNLRKALWSRCMEKAIQTQFGTANYVAYGEALRTIMYAYEESCKEVRDLEKQL